MIAYGSIYFFLGMLTLCAILFRNELIDWCLVRIEKLYRQYRLARHIVRAIKAVIKDERAEREERRRAFEIMKLQCRQIEDAARVQELKNAKKNRE